MHYEAVEIGTSDFDVADLPAGSNVIYVEPVIEHLNSLRRKLRSKKLNARYVNAAVFEESRLESADPKIFFVQPIDIKKHELPDWVYGCNSIDKPHIEVVEILKQRGLSQDLIASRAVPKTCLRELIVEHEVSSIGLLKYDTEGMDTRLVISALLELQPGQLPKVVQFESNHLSKPKDVSTAISLWRRAGYTLLCRTKDVVMTKF